MTEEKNLCMHCIKMRDTDGYCPLYGYVSAMNEAPRRCFVDRRDLTDEGDYATGKALHSKPTRPRWRSGYVTPPGTKYCSTCNRVLPREQFGSCQRNHDGLNWQCKECAAARQRALKAARKALSIGQDKPSSAGR